MNVTRFHHVSVNSNGASLDAMVDFYRDVLGLGDKPRPEIPGIGGHWHTVGDQELHLVDAPSVGPGIDPTGHHYCVAVDDLDAAIAELETRGIEYVRAVQGENTVQIWIVDPAGNTIELQQETRENARSARSAGGE
jgi:catechol 2,3-dioxygenase-like lactoylglutathione lyase family enzyme